MRFIAVDMGMELKMIRGAKILHDHKPELQDLSGFPNPLCIIKDISVENRSN